jgi:hypothetical protein
VQVELKQHIHREDEGIQHMFQAYDTAYLHENDDLHDG